MGSEYFNRFQTLVHKNMEEQKVEKKWNNRLWKLIKNMFAGTISEKIIYKTFKE
jgi:hypothetical protein